MKERITHLGAAVAGGGALWLGTVKWCCVLPVVFSMLGLTGTATAVMAARWLSPGLAMLSLALLARSFYHLYGKGRGNRAGRITTWVSAALMVVFWALRLFHVFPA